MKEKVYAVCLTKTFRDKSYGEPELTLCKTRDIARREFISTVSSNLNDYLDDEYEDEDGNFITKDEMTVEQKAQWLTEEGYDISLCMDEGNESMEFTVSDESSTSIYIIETDMITE